jgi:hypothetical protein
LLSRTAIPDVVFKDNEILTEALKEAGKELFYTTGVRVFEWLSCHHGWIASFQFNELEHIAFVMYGQKRAIIMQWIENPVKVSAHT